MTDCYYLVQDNPPVPTNPDVHIESADSEVFAVSSFGGTLAVMQIFCGANV